MRDQRDTPYGTTLIAEDQFVGALCYVLGAFDSEGASRSTNCALEVQRWETPVNQPQASFKAGIRPPSIVRPGAQQRTLTQSSKDPAITGVAHPGCRTARLFRVGPLC